MKSNDEDDNDDEEGEQDKNDEDVEEDENDDIAVIIKTTEILKYIGGVKKIKEEIQS